MKRSNLVAARIQAGYNSQQEFVDSLRIKGYSLSVHEYGNIENGRKKEVGIGIAMIIAEHLNKVDEVANLFLPLPTYKIRQVTHLPDSNDKPGAA